MVVVTSQFDRISVALHITESIVSWLCNCIFFNWEILLRLNIMLSFLIPQTGGTEEVYKEEKRQQELENNYRFVWGESQEESQSSSTSDSDDVDI